MSRHQKPKDNAIEEQKNGASSRKGKKVTAHSLQAMKREGHKISAVTCYDAAFARLIDTSSIDMVLVGDSLGNVVLGFDSTIPVTMDHMVHHSAAVSRALSRPFLVADMPFMSYQVSQEQAVANAARLIQEGGAEAVKLEGGEEILDTVSQISSAGIPVVAHLGLTPQKIHALGGYRVQGRGEDAAYHLISAAENLQAAGAVALVLEMIPQSLAQIVSKKLAIPTIGIGAGPETDGQILVLHDLLGLDGGFKPKFLKTYCDLGRVVHDAIETYTADVQQSRFPSREHSFD